jgi:hypothetical protein
MVDWRQSLPQIIAAIIGSSLIATALSTINSSIFKPTIEISVHPVSVHPDQDLLLPQNISYRIALKNVGYSPATHLRLTMSYPGANIIRYTRHHEDENMTLTTEKLTSSVVAFLPRLTSGSSISIDINISRRSIEQLSNYAARPLGDYSDNPTLYQYAHMEPYSVIATYDQGSSAYSPSSFESGIGFANLYFNMDILKTLILILLAFLFFAIPLRHKRRSRSKFASDVLKDITNVRNELEYKANNDPSATILRLHTWHSNTDTELQIINDYKDYQKINDFYTLVKTRNDKLLQNPSSDYELKKLNENCVNQATIAYTEINWRKFHRLDLVLIIPLVILSSLFITYICEGIPLFLFYDRSFVLLYVVTSVAARGLSSFFLIREILKHTQGVIINHYALPSVFRSFAFLIISFAIVGAPDLLIWAGITYAPNYISSIISSFFNMSIIAVMTDIGRLFLLTWVISKRYMKHNIKIHNHLSRWQRVKIRMT